MGLSRRTIILGSGLLGAAAGVGGWALLAENRIVPGRSVLDNVLGRCDITTPPLDASPGRLVRSSFYSTHRSTSVNYALAYPPNVPAGAKLPVCLVLHGYGGSERDAFDGVGYQHLQASAVQAGAPPFVLASVAGGPGYWHPHDSGDDPLGMLTSDFPTVLAQHGLPVDRFGVLGWSMGGFGALLYALANRDRCAVAVANAPAFWHSYDEARKINSGAFDSATEWSRWGDLLSRAPDFHDLRVRIAVGDSDPFQPIVSTLRSRLADPSVVTFAKGCHDERFWQYGAPSQLRFIAETLAATHG
jgi:S-formylglutathione hydrolase FrmB